MRGASDFMTHYLLHAFYLMSFADPVEYIQLVSQDLSGFFTSIPTERFHQALKSKWGSTMSPTGPCMRSSLTVAGESSRASGAA